MCSKIVCQHWSGIPSSLPEESPLTPRMPWSPLFYCLWRFVQIGHFHKGHRRVVNSRVWLLSFAQCVPRIQFQQVSAFCCFWLSSALLYGSSVRHTVTHAVANTCGKLCVTLCFHSLTCLYQGWSFWATQRVQDFGAPSPTPPAFVYFRHPFKRHLRACKICISLTIDDVKYLLRAYKDK